jgi:bacterioferritin (cytochrome b1)
MWRWTTEEARDDAGRRAIEEEVEEEEEEEEDLETQITIVNVIIP